MTITLRKYQRDSVDSIFSYFASGAKGNPLVVIPTAGGKSCIIAKFIEETLKQWPNERFLMLAHRKELLQQNCEKVLKLWPEAPVGIYSAGLGMRQLNKKITIAGIQSIYNKAKELGYISVVLIDEVHLTPPDGEGMYQQLLNGLAEINPNVRMVGFTATPYRMKTGTLVDDGGFFTDIAYEAFMPDLIRDGYLSPLVSKQPKAQADLSRVHIRGGEFVAGEAEAAMDDEALTERAIDEMEEHCSDRKSWIIFAAGVEHAKHVAEALRRRGHNAEAVVGEDGDMFRASTLRRFKSGELKCLVNCDILTTGFDAPNIDALVLLRPTKSVGLYVQMVGRASRLSPQTGKKDAIVLDFAGNIERHGPVDAVRVVKRRTATGEKSEVQTAPVKTCPECRTACLIREPRCPVCGYEWPKAPVHDIVASYKPILSTQNQIRVIEVSSVTYARHEKLGKTASMRVKYNPVSLSERPVSEWVCFEHLGFARQKAHSWWSQHVTPGQALGIPQSVNDALARTGELKPIKEIHVRKEGEFDRVLKVVFKDVSTPAPMAVQPEEEKDDIDRMIESYNIF